MLAVDKTGTLTENRMQVAELQEDAHFVHAGATTTEEPFHELVEFAMLATPAVRLIRWKRRSSNSVCIG